MSIITKMECIISENNKLKQMVESLKKENEELQKQKGDLQMEIQRNSIAQQTSSSAIPS